MHPLFYKPQNSTQDQFKTPSLLFFNKNFQNIPQIRIVAASIFYSTVRSSLSASLTAVWIEMNEFY